MHTLYTCEFAKYGEELKQEVGVFTEQQIIAKFRKGIDSKSIIIKCRDGRIFADYKKTRYVYTPTDSEGERAFRYWNLWDSEKEFETEYAVK